MTEGEQRLYKILFGIQITSILVVAGCAAYLAGYFG